MATLILNESANMNLTKDLSILKSGVLSLNKILKQCSGKEWGGNTFLWFWVCISFCIYFSRKSLKTLEKKENRKIIIHCLGESK